MDITGVVLLLRGQVFLVDAGDDDVVGVDHLRQVDFRHFREELVRIELREAIVIVYPADQLGKGDPKSRPVDSDR